jgi:hypothetical protein
MEPSKGLQVLARGVVQLDRQVDLEVQAQLVPVEHGDAALDDAGVLQPLDAPPAGARRKAHALGDLGHRQAGVMLDQVQDTGVDGVERFGQNHLPGGRRRESAQLGRGSAMKPCPCVRAMITG